MAENRYIVTHSNYTIKKKHKLLSGHTIYERDYMTTTNLGGFDSGSIPYGESNFKIIINDGKNLRRKHKYGDWLKNENCKDSSGGTCDYFSLNNLPSSGEKITSETKIVLKPNKNTFNDFSYYGSCKEMIRSSIDEIMVKFPAELCVTEFAYDFVDVEGNLSHLGGDDMVVVDNPFLIDITSVSTPLSEKNKPSYNPLRYFSESVKKYRVIIDDENEFCVDTWDVNLRNKNCFKDGDITATITLNSGTTNEMVIVSYYKNGENILVTNKKYIGYRIRPTDVAINKSFNELNDFSRFLVDRESNPIYSIDIDVPTESNIGVVTTRRKYSWPTNYGYNLDVTSGAFNRYYESLLEIGEFYDQYRSNNLWRKMTHDSIKNMDHTHSNPSKDEDNDDYRLGTTRLHDILLIIGRFFDDMKRNIDNLKTSNTVTYNENNNTPDYFLTDTLQLSGWEVKSAVETLNSDTKTKPLYPGNNKRYDLSEANIHFLRNLKLNSKALFSRKGTINGIEMLLSIFGYCSYDWARKYYESLPNNKKKNRGRKVLSWDELDEEIKMSLYDYSLDEYVVTIKNSQDDLVSVDSNLPIEEYAQYIADINVGDPQIDRTYGLPVKIVNVMMVENNETITKKYIIPWFKKNEKLYGSPYFQMYGGWGKRNDMDITPNNELYPNVKRIKTNSGFTIYDETKKYLKIVNTLDELSNINLSDINNGDIYYVNDITNFSDYYSGETLDDATNYFYIEDKNNSYFYGINEDGERGWMNITKETLKCENCEDNPSNEAYKVMYLESIIELNSGNNPHVGYGNYDDGESYLDYYRQIFKGVIEEGLLSEDAYNCDTGEVIDEITNYGFDLQKPVVDNVKTWYFTDNTKENIRRLEPVTKTVFSDNDPEMETYDLPVGYEESESTDTVSVGNAAYRNGEVSFKTELSAFNMETQEENNNDEAAANSIINTKKLVLKFNDKYSFVKGFREYLYTVILPYIKQLIPSTTIFEVELGENNADFTCFNFNEVVGVTK